MDTQTETTEVESAPEAEPTETPAAEPTEREAAPVERTSRADRKRQRIDVEAANRERDELKKRIETEAQERQRIASELSELRGRWEQSQRQTQQADKHAEKKTKIGDLRRQAKAQLSLSAQYAAAGKHAEADKAWEEWERLSDEANDLRGSIASESEWEKRRGEITQGMPDPASQREAQFLNSRFPWLEGSRKAQALADEHMRDLIAQGKPATRETAVEAIAWAGKTLGLGGQTTPTNGQRRLYAGVSGGEGPGGGDDRPKAPQRTVGNERLALAAYPKLEPKEAFRQWQKDMVAAMGGGEEDDG